MIKSHSPSILTCTPPLCSKFAASVDQRQDIAFDMPFRMASGTLLNVCRISFMSSFPEGFAYFLRFLTGN